MAKDMNDDRERDEPITGVGEEKIRGVAEDEDEFEETEDLDDDEEDEESTTF